MTKVFIVYGLWRTENGLAEVPFGPRAYTDPDKAIARANDLIDWFKNEHGYILDDDYDVIEYFESIDDYTRTYKNPDSDWAFVEIVIEKSTLNNEKEEHNHENH